MGVSSVQARDHTGTPDFLSNRRTFFIPLHPFPTKTPPARSVPYTRVVRLIMPIGIIRQLLNEMVV